MLTTKIFSRIFAAFLFLPLLVNFSIAQIDDDDEENKKPQQDVRVMTIPISIFSKQELKSNQISEFVEAGNLSVQEDGVKQEILSIKSVSNTPLSIAIIIQEDLDSTVNLQLRNIKDFIRELPADSRVMVAYLRGGTTVLRQKFTKNLEKAADSIRIIPSSSSVAPRTPYDGVRDTIKRFKGQPRGRRAILLISDGLDVSNGLSNSTPGQSIDLDRAITEAQTEGIAVYSIYSSATLTENGSSFLILNAQSSLAKISKQTGGRAFFQGSSTPISFKPFLRDIGLTLSRQFAISYLSTNSDNGFHKVTVTSSNPEIEIEHPKGYYHRKRKR